MVSSVSRVAWASRPCGFKTWARCPCYAELFRRSQILCSAGLRRLRRLELSAVFVLAQHIERALHRVVPLAAQLFADELPGAGIVRPHLFHTGLLHRLGPRLGEVQSVADDHLALG